MIDPADICNHLYALARERNGKDIAMELNGVPVLLLQRHESADHVLRTRASNYRKNMDWFRQALGASRFSEDGEAWRLRRELTHAYFTHFDRDRTCALARHHASLAVERMLGDSAAGATVIDDGTLREMTVSVLIENFFGIPFADTGVDLQRIAELMEYGSAYSFVPAGQTSARYGDGLRRLPALRREVLRELRAFRDGRVPAGPMLAGMLAADDDPGNDIVLEHELLTFFAAGAETSAATMSWVCYLLARHPDMQEDLRARVATVDEDGGWRALAECDGLANFISEALRLFPPTPIVGRLALAADRIGGNDIDAGQNVLISFIGIGHDARLRADPWALDDAGARRGATAGSNLAFSFGPRVCGGKHFALVELMAFLEVFLSRARFELTSSAAPRFHWKAQMLREGGQPVRTVPAGHAASTRPALAQVHGG